MIDLNKKKVIVTGADGFIGSHLVEQLVLSGCQVTALTFYNSWNSKGWLEDLDENLFNEINVVSGDIRDTEFVKNLISGHAYVFHLSSLIAIPHSYTSPRSYVDTNIVGALNVLEACKANKSLIRLLHVSTSEVYGSAQFVPITECHPLVGQSPYAATKIAADKIAESYNLSFGLPVVIARPFNTYGPRQTSRAVIPSIMSQVLSGRDEIHIGTMSTSRDFNYVDDTVFGMMKLAACEQAEGMTVNIGSGKETTISELVDVLIGMANRPVKIKLDEKRLRPAPSEVDRLVAGNSKLRELVGWTPETSLLDGLEKTKVWMEKNLSAVEHTLYST